MSIRMRLITVLGTMSLLAMGALTAVFLLGNALIVGERATTTEQHAVDAAVATLDRALGEQVAAVRSFVLIADDRALSPYELALEDERLASAAPPVQPFA